MRLSLGEAALPADPYQLADGIYVPPWPVVHRDEAYDRQGFELLQRMQRDHFWYRGRHRFLLYAVRRRLAAATPGPALRVVDLGGGCGGWLAYLLRHAPNLVAEAALADSSTTALSRAASCLPPAVRRYQIDLRALQWHERWDLAFLLDVLEHLPDERQVLQEIRAALAPGGLLFVTVPALGCFWSWNDEAVGHLRRYRRRDFEGLARDSGLRLLDARYFQFFLSPLLLVTRWLARRTLRRRSRAELWRLVERTHRVPHPVVNAALTALFAAETPLGHYLRFPWGTSLLAVLQRQ